jgi:hypothetical protein
LQRRDRTDDNTEIFVEDLRAKTGLKPIVKGIEARFEPQLAGNTVFMQTNWKAANNRVLRWIS